MKRSRAVALVVYMKLGYSHKVIQYYVLQKKVRFMTVFNSGRSGKIKFRLVASTYNSYQAEVRYRTFLGVPVERLNENEQSYG
jgi:hypothetical protein